MQVLPFVAGARGREARLPAGRWFTRAEVLVVDGRAELTTADEECCALLLSGTFDLQGGGTVWQSRGARTTPTGGRPMAVFLPPRTPFSASGGSGEILLLGANQPPSPLHASGRDALRQSPLLPLAGSGKAFDPDSGEWKPAETFPTAPESLPPRRMERLDLGSGIVVERVFAHDYKAMTLTVDETVLPAGTELALAELAPASAGAALCYVRPERELQVRIGDGAPITVAAESAIRIETHPAEVRLRATGGPVYAVLAYAGK